MNLSEKSLKDLLRSGNSFWVDFTRWADCCIFQPVFGCCALQMLVKILIFNILRTKKQKNAKNAKKCKKMQKNYKFAAKFRKKWGLKSCTESWSSVLFPEKIQLSLKLCRLHYLGQTNQLTTCWEILTYRIANHLQLAQNVNISPIVSTN